MKYIILITLTSMLILSTKVHALECTVEFIAKKTVEESRLFGARKKSEFKSGEKDGKGSNKNNCRNNALSDLLKNGWKITSEKTKIK